MRWANLDLDGGVWTKPAGTTKQAREHRVPLSPPSVALLRDIRPKIFAGEYVFPIKGGYRRTLGRLGAAFAKCSDAPSFGFMILGTLTRLSLLARACRCP